ncbi:DUF4334 domain-containing protein [Terribacillus saccharophilus]|uniref:GXWXG protein n=1 Tax=Terribacillus saccharophilus TaxID=361277 RepID=A0A268A6G5_9BACI|nr:DUF4334 domain-containing protein [Terribacillus saccharophilus]PAD19669.1 hypothetical protein CHH64_17795 [Terribacillus saccharophilus]PAF18589.1 hypothetical protein CHH51_07050 [Terribacillus saccharophilus]PAF20302.1 hypothetical protein CHH49_16800 [Terribacillus saccharophilus]PAF34658.1 hypothetical protein CHH69_14650 [Terribacillus saccharophilus]
MENIEFLNIILRDGTSQSEAFAFYDQLDIVEPEQMIGMWKGEEIVTGHPLEGLLTASGWYGKEFIDEEHVHPLIFKKSNGVLYTISPSLLPLNLLLQSLKNIPKQILSPSMTILRPILNTNKSAARLRKVNHRGKVTSAMIYDNKGIIDIFRKIDENTLLGIMDIKEQSSDKTFFFILRKA